jgi:hypothetical protein
MEILNRDKKKLIINNNDHREVEVNGYEDIETNFYVKKRKM